MSEDNTLPQQVCDRLFAFYRKIDDFIEEHQSKTVIIQFCESGDFLGIDRCGNHLEITIT